MFRSTPALSSPIRVVLAFVLFASITVVGSVSQAALAAPTSCSRGLNLSWEAPVISSNWALVNPASVPGWETSGPQILIWKSGFFGVEAVDGDQLALLGVFTISPSWQDVPTLEGDQISWSFSHRAFSGTATVVVRMGSTSSQSDQGTFTTGTAAFERYAGTYTVPIGQTTTRFMLAPQDFGNFVDDVTLALDCEISVVSSLQGSTDPDGSSTVEPRRRTHLPVPRDE